MLGDEGGAAADEGLGALALGCFVEPAARVGDFHGDGDVRLFLHDGACAEEEGGVARNDFCIRICADVTDLDVAVCIVVVGFELACFVHCNELHAGSDACKISALIDVCERIVVVCNARGVGKGARRVAELNFGEFLSCLKDEFLMAEGVCEDDVAALIDEIGSRIVAVVVLGDARLHDELGALLFAGGLDRVDEILVVCRIFIMQGDEADLDAAVRCVVLAGCKQACARDRHGRGKTQSQKFLHTILLLHNNALKIGTGGRKKPRCFTARGR